MWNKLRVHRQRAAGDMPDKYFIGRMICDQYSRCIYCGISLYHGFHIDHKIPVSKNGTNDIDNLQLLCPTCNMKKGVIPHTEYAERVGLAEIDRSSSLPDWFDVDNFIVAMESENYQEAIKLCQVNLAQTIERLSR